MERQIYSTRRNGDGNNRSSSSSGSRRDTSSRWYIWSGEEGSRGLGLNWGLETHRVSSSGIFFWLPVIARLTTVVIFVCFFARSFFLFLICFFLLSYAFFVSYTFFCFCTLDLLILVIFAFEHFSRSYL